MCSPRPVPVPPPSQTINDRNAQQSQLTMKIAQEEAAGHQVYANLDKALLKKILAQPVDPNSLLFAPKVGTAGQTVAPSADNLELAPEKLQGLLAKRATSTLRIPTTLPKTTR